MVPAHRLVTLLQQAKDFQIRQCLFHLRFADGPHSLLLDHSCDSNAFPSATIKVLTGHKDEVWDIKFSHDGTKLASSSKDSSVIIWDTEVHILTPDWADFQTWEQLHVFRDHTGGVPLIDWSPDDERLLTASHDHKVKMWFTDVRPSIFKVNRIVWQLRTNDGTQRNRHSLSVVPRWTDFHLSECRQGNHCVESGRDYN